MISIDERKRRMTSFDSQNKRRIPIADWNKYIKTILFTAGIIG
jgi:hypothetical protein